MHTMLLMTTETEISAGVPAPLDCIEKFTFAIATYQM